MKDMAESHDRTVLKTGQKRTFPNEGGPQLLILAEHPM